MGAQASELANARDHLRSAEQAKAPPRVGCAQAERRRQRERLGSSCSASCLRFLLDPEIPDPGGSPGHLEARHSGGAGARSRLGRRDQTPAGGQPSAAARRALPRHAGVLAPRSRGAAPARQSLRPEAARGRRGAAREWPATSSLALAAAMLLSRMFWEAAARANEGLRPRRRAGRVQEIPLRTAWTAAWTRLSS